MEIDFQITHCSPTLTLKLTRVLAYWQNLNKTYQTLQLDTDYV